MIDSLTSIQKGVYLECAAHPESTLYNLPFLGRFRESTDPEKLRAALLKAVSAHPALNAVLTDRDGDVCMQADERPFEIPIITLSDEAFAETRRTLVRPFALGGGKLARIEIYQTLTSLWLFEDMHHLICDGSSWSVFASDVRRALDGMEPEAETVSAFDLAKQEDAWLKSEEAKAAEAYWRALLTDCEPDCKPERDRWEETPGQAWLTRDFTLDEERFSALRHQAGCSSSAFFTAAFA